VRFYAAWYLSFIQAQAELLLEQSHDQHISHGCGLRASSNLRRLRLLEESSRKGNCIISITTLSILVSKRTVEEAIISRSVILGCCSGACGPEYIYFYFELSRRNYIGGPRKKALEQTSI
jgi:hypothetical protein